MRLKHTPGGGKGGGGGEGWGGGEGGGRGGGAGKPRTGIIVYTDLYIYIYIVWLQSISLLTSDVANLYLSASAVT